MDKEIEILKLKINLLEKEIELVKLKKDAPIPPYYTGTIPCVDTWFGVNRPPTYSVASNTFTTSTIN
jgi:hypothetical protein